jgi:membrane protein YdbS with pleckstrin-like domain
MNFAGPVRRSNTAPRAATMYSAFRQLCERWLRIPPEPEAPPGDESTARVFRAAPKYLNYLRVLWGIRAGLMLLIAMIPVTIVGLLLTRNLDPAASAGLAVLCLFVVGILVVQTMIQLAIVQLDYEKRWYVVTDRSLRIREGVMTVKEITFTFANIQNLSITQGPIQRMLGIADLKVETAGGGSHGGNPQAQAAGLNLHTAYFRGIDNAEELKQLIGDRMRGHRDTGLGDHDDPGLHVARSTGSPDGVVEALAAVLAEARMLRTAVEQ